MRKKDYVDERRRKKEERSIIRPKQWGGKGDTWDEEMERK